MNSERRSHWTLETDGNNIAWLELNSPGSVNVLSETVMLELDQCLDELAAQNPSGLVLFSGKKNSFIAGADVNEFPKLSSVSEAEVFIRSGHRVAAKLENLPCSSVAVLNGMALGGGLELALACSQRIAFASERKTMGLPEVQLGLHPGLGGTVRSVELLGVRAAMELMLKGKPITPGHALAIGLIDKISSEQEWKTDAAELAAGGGPSRSVPFVDRLLNLAPVRPLLAQVLSKQVAGKLNPEHYPAPFKLIELWRRTGSQRDSFAAEARSFAHLMFTSTSQSLVRVFFLQDRLKGLAKASDRSFVHVHVVGAGTMGSDIAAWCAARGLNVTLQDREQQHVDNGLERARNGLLRKFRNRDQVAEIMTRLIGDHNGTGVDTADLIIEAIFEDLNAKQALFKHLEANAQPDAVLATNTSSIPLADIASALQRPERLIGLHFFNPVAQMPLVEVVADSASARSAIDAGTTFVKQINKLPLPCRSTPGFLVNRILAPYMDEAFRLYEEGYQAEAIDKAATDFGMPVGPLALADSVGLDILMHVADIVGPTIGRTASPGIKTMVDAGRLGEKSGAGFYEWQDGKPQKNAKAVPAPQQVQDRLILALVNEAAACLQDNVVADAQLADAGTIFGAGFAPFRGGPFNYAQTEGLEAILNRLKVLQSEHGDRFKPSAGWQKIKA